MLSYIAHRQSYARFAEAPREWGLWARPLEERKGAFGGQCQRFACVNRDARWLNELDGFYYCGVCAETFNEAALRGFQSPPCVLLAEHDA